MDILSSYWTQGKREDQGKRIFHFMAVALGKENCAFSFFGILRIVEISITPFAISFQGFHPD
jgi:hypothetical protein